MYRLQEKSAKTNLNIFYFRSDPDPLFPDPNPTQNEVDPTTSHIVFIQFLRNFFPLCTKCTTEAYLYSIITCLFDF